MNSKDKNAYEAPRLTVVEFRSERGYTTSDTTPTIRELARNLDREVGNLVTLEMEHNNLFGPNQHLHGRNENGSADGGMAAGYFTYEDGNSWF